jgi:hypothetical protein
VRQKKVERVMRLAQWWEWGAIAKVKAEPAAEGKRRGREKKAAGQLRDDVVTEGGRRAVNKFFSLGGQKKKNVTQTSSKEALGFHQQFAPYSMAGLTSVRAISIESIYLHQMVCLIAAEQRAAAAFLCARRIARREFFGE